MRIKYLMKKAENENSIRETIKEGYFLGSIFTMMEDVGAVKEWRLLFYNPGLKKICEFFYRDGRFERGECEPREKEIQRLDADKLRIEFEEAMDIAKQSFDKKISSKALSYLVSLHVSNIDEKPTIVWTINIIYSGMNVQTYNIDAVSGEIVKEESTSLVTIK